MIQYHTINDAAEATGNQNYGKGQTQIWYWKKEHSRDLMMGPAYLLKNEPNLMPDPKSLETTHVLIGSIRASNLNEVYKIMQGEEWSPNGEARGIIQQSGTGHTSMSVGDIIQIGSHVWMVDNVGFKKLASEGQTLLKEITRLAAEQPELRKHLVPVIRKYTVGS